MIDYDVETTGLQPDWHKAFLYQFGDDTGTVEVLYPDQDRSRIQYWFDRGKVEGIRAHNAKFDRAFGDLAGFDLPGDGCWHDSMIVAHALDERRSVALKNLAANVLGDGSDDLQKEVKKWLSDERARRKKDAKEAREEIVEPNYSDVPRELMEKYAAEDIVLTRRISDHYEPILRQTPDLLEVVEFERNVLDALYAVERRGFPADEQAYRLLEIEVIENLEKIDDTIQELARLGVEPEDLETFNFNPKSSQQIYKALVRRNADMTHVEGESMDVENLSTVDDPLAVEILRFRSEFKALSTYIRPYIGRSYETSIRAWKEAFIAPDGRIHANYRQLGARTGRMSCSDPNIQNQPRDDLRLRYNYRAEPGMKLVTCDLNSVEMAVFAAYTGEGRLLEAIKEGRDPHAETAELIGIRDRARPSGDVETGRQRAKMFNFSKIYGGGQKTIMKQLRCSREDAKRYNNRYNEAYPEISRLAARIEWRLYDSGYIKSAWGRRFRSDNPKKEGYKFTNYLVQGTAADILKATLIRLHKEGVPVVACVHDEIIAHVPEADAEEAKQTIIEALTDHPRITDKVPLTADGAIVDRWSQAKKPDFVPQWARSE